MSVWFITGASSGLGYAMAETALADGDAVVAGDREPDGIERLAKLEPERTLAIQFDVANADGARAAFDAAVKHFGRVDVVVNNAGYGHVGAVEELTDADLHRQLEVNLYGVINVTRAALPHLRRQRSGHLVQM